MREPVHRIDFAIRDLDGAHDWFRRYGAEQVPAKAVSPGFVFRGTILSLGQITLADVSYNAPASVVLPGGLRDPAVFQSMGTEAIELEAGARTMTLKPKESLLVPAGKPFAARWPTMRAVVLSLPDETLRRDATATLGLPSALELDFARPLSPDAEQHWRATTRYAQSCADRPDLTAAPLVRRELTWAISGAVLACFPDSALTPPAPEQGVRSPRSLLKALNYIDAHAAEPISLTEICRAAALTPRGLQASFRRHLQTTPLAHLRAVRMERAHRDLSAGRERVGATVGAVAIRWGFGHLGRFATDYKRRFGVSPSETLRG